MYMLRVFSPSCGVQIYKSHYTLFHDSYPPTRLTTPILLLLQKLRAKVSNHSPGAFTRHANVRTTVKETQAKLRVPDFIPFYNGMGIQRVPRAYTVLLGHSSNPDPAPALPEIHRT